MGDHMQGEYYCFLVNVDLLEHTTSVGWIRASHDKCNSKESLAFL